MQRLVFGVLKEFSKTDQVLYTTHSPAFVDVTNYQCIGVVRKEDVNLGTCICQCPENVFGDPDERKTFMLLNAFSLQQNQLFFAQKIILVEGEMDLIAIIATGNKLGLFTEFPEERGYTVIVAGNKGAIPKFQRVLNAFTLPYVVLHEMDGQPEGEAQNKAIISLLCGNRRVAVPGCLEAMVGLSKHFDNVYHAKIYFSDANNISEDLEECVKNLFS